MSMEATFIPNKTFKTDFLILNLSCCTAGGANLTMCLAQYQYFFMQVRASSAELADDSAGA